MAVHSICPALHKTASAVERADSCLIVVGLFGNYFSIFCTHLSWDVVGSFLGIFNIEKNQTNTGA